MLPIQTISQNYLKGHLLKKFAWILSNQWSQTFHGHFSTDIQSTQTSDVLDPNVEVEYPPIKPKYPPGKWGSMSPRMAWRWHDNAEKHHSIPTMRERFWEMKRLRRTWKFPSFNHVPNMLDYQLYVTKTHLIEGLPDYYSHINIDSHLDTARSLVSDILLQHLWYTDSSRRHLHITPKPGLQERKRKLTREVLYAMVNAVVTSLSPGREYLLRSQVDEDVRVEAVWDRHGFPRKWPRGVDRYDWVKIQEAALNSRFQGTHLADVMLRTERPLKPVVPFDDPLCQECTYPVYKYRPSAVGQPWGQHRASTIPGTLMGNPCEFGQLSVVTTINHKEMDNPDPDVVTDMEIGGGVAANFTWLVAQAGFQGFSSFADVTQPFCAQTIITDGQYMRFFTSQLNTLTLWKDDEGNSVQNLCWYSPKMPLYTSIENGEIHGLNDDVITWLLKFLLNEPGELQSLLDTKLPEGYVRPQTVDNFIEHRVEEVIEEEEEILYD